MFIFLGRRPDPVVTGKKVGYLRNPVKYTDPLINQMIDPSITAP